MRDNIDICASAIGYTNSIWENHYGQTMLVDKSVTNAMQACHVSKSFGESKWPAKCLSIKFECKKFLDITISKGHHNDFINLAWDHARSMGNVSAQGMLATLRVEWGPDHKGIPMWMNDVVLYTINTPRGLVFGNLPSECGEPEIRDGIEGFVSWQGYDDETKHFMETTLMALKVINYSAIPYFAPTKINKWDKKELKSAKKKYKVKGKKSLYRVVYLPKKIRDYQEKKGHKKTGPLKNGRVGHLRELRSAYFVNKQGEDILIPPIPDCNGNYPKIIYKVKKPKDLAA